MMVMPTLIAIVIGVMLGLRFKVFILIPANVIGSAAAFGAGLAFSDSLWSVLLAMVLAIVALQIGYLAGTVLTTTRVSKGSSRTVAVAQRPVH